MKTCPANWEWPQNRWLPPEYACPHGVGHGLGVHGCDGCCSSESFEKRLFLAGGSWEKLVRHFMVRSGQRDMPQQRQIELYGALMCEEFKEWDVALKEEDTLDACVDLIWVTLGYMLAKGYDIDAAFREVARANFDKIKGGVKKDKRGKIIKPKGWTPPKLTSFLGSEND